MEKPGSIKVVEVRRVAAELRPPEDLSLPLTFFNLRWLKFPPPQHLFFYNMPSFDTSHFFDSVLPKLKTSLSATLQHFVPLTGNLIWLLDSPKPFLSYIKGDAVLFIIAESDVDFHRLISSNNFDIKAKEYHPLMPQLLVSHDKATVLALQITIFPKDNFSIGSAIHHAGCDGLSAISFFKFWGHFCKHGEGGGLPPMPSHNKKVITDLFGLQAIYLNEWVRLGGPNNRSLMFLEARGPRDRIRGTFEFTCTEIEMLRRLVMRTIMAKKKEQADHSKLLHLSTYLLTCAYTLVCLVRAEEIKTEKVLFMIRPSVTANFENCLARHRAVVETKRLLGEDGLLVSLNAISEVIKSLDKTFLVGAETWVSRIFNVVQQPYTD